MVGFCTTKLLLLVAVDPPMATVIAPVDAPLGTATTSCVVVAEATLAVTPLNRTTLLEAVALKFAPAIVTVVPTGPVDGEKPLIAGGGVTVKLPLLVAVLLLTVTEIVPLVAPVGAATTSCVAVAELTVAVVPLNLTVLLELVVLKFVPWIVTDVPTGPLVGVNEVIVGLPPA